jgi:hypothetical protein
LKDKRKEIFQIWKRLNNRRKDFQKIRKKLEVRRNGLDNAGAQTGRLKFEDALSGEALEGRREVLQLSSFAWNSIRTLSHHLHRFSQSGIRPHEARKSALGFVKTTIHSGRFAYVDYCICQHATFSLFSSQKTH